MNGETNSADGSSQNGTRTSTNNSDGGDSQGRAPRKVKLRWKNELQHKFLEAIEYLGIRKAMPKTIQEFMNVKGVTRTHIASHLQKYRRHLKRLKQKARKAEMARRNRYFYTNSALFSYFNPQGSYKDTKLNMDDLFQSQLGYGPGQWSLILNKNASINYMHHDQPINDLDQTSLLPMGGSGVLPLNKEMRSFLATPQVSRVPGLGQYGTPNGSLGMNSNQGTGYMRSYYAGISVDANGNLVGVDGADRVDANGYGSLGESFAGMSLNFNDNNMSSLAKSTSRVPSTFGASLANGGQTHSNLIAQMDDGFPRSILGTSQASQVPGFGQYGTRNDVYDAGINTNEYGDWTGLGGARVNGNGPLGENVGSTSRLSPPWKFFVNEDRAQNNLNVQLDGLIPILESLSVCNDGTGNTVNSQFDQNQQKRQVSAGNSKLSNDVPEENAISNWKFDNHQEQVVVGNSELSNDVLLENNAINNWSFDNHQGQESDGNHEKYTINNWSFNNYQGQVSAGNPELSNNDLLEGNAINNWSFNNHQGQVSAGNFELSNDILLERNAINNWMFNNQVNVGYYELDNDVLLEGNAISNGSFDNHQGQVNAGSPELANDVLFERNVTSNWNFGNVNDYPTEETLNSIFASSKMYIPTPGMNTINQEQGRNEQASNSIAANSEMCIRSPTPDISTINQLEQGVADLAEVPLPPIDLDWTEGDPMNFMIDIDDLF